MEDVPVEAPRLLGREQEVERILRLLDGTELLPAAAVLPGEPGIGKTTLWLAGLDGAAARGYRVLSARPSGAETQFSFVGLTDLLGSAAGDLLPELPPIQRRALEAAAARRVGNPRRRASRGRSFLGALRLLARDGPLCLAVDDVQWLDAVSLAVLRHALARLDGVPVATLLAIRGDVPEWLRHAVPENRLERIDVGGLSLGATHELLHTRLGAHFARPTLIRLWETSRGNPFFALELASALQRRGGSLAPGDELPIPADLDRLLYERIEVLGAAALEVVHAVAALARPTVELVEAAVGAGFEAGLAAALQARILELDRERVRFTHPLLGTAVTTHQTPADRRSLHARLAHIVLSAEERARHLALAASEPDSDVASILDEARGRHTCAARPPPPPSSPSRRSGSRPPPTSRACTGGRCSPPSG